MMLERYRRSRPVVWGPVFGAAGRNNSMNRMLSDFFGEEDSRTVSTLTPAMDLIDTKDSVKVRVELPGIAKDDVEISLKEDTLTIKGEKKQEKEDIDENRYYVERSFGSFVRTLNLTSKVKADAVEAKFRDGVLEINLTRLDGGTSTEVRVEID